jgi:D-cysteine desulfhydrase
MNLSRFPRRRYTQGATPLEKMHNLTRHLGGPNIYFKRDDLLGLTSGGNKTRKLEFLVAEALAAKADTLITVGAVQSNHCRLTLAAAVKEGLKCRLVLEERVPGSYNPSASGNNFLYQLLGVESIKVVPAGTDLGAAMDEIADQLAAEGRKGYVIPGGGSTPLGALGYVACAEEIMTQSFDQEIQIDHIVCASGSAGTHAGLLVGLEAGNRGIPLTGINVRRKRAEQEKNVHALAVATADLLRVSPPPPDKVVALDEWVGPGYSIPTAEMVEAVRLVARLEGVLLDPVYTGKAAAGLLDLVRRKTFDLSANVVFLHTGGSPALYAYQETILQ